MHTQVDPPLPKHVSPEPLADVFRNYFQDKTATIPSILDRRAETQHAVQTTEQQDGSHPYDSLSPAPEEEEKHLDGKWTRKAFAFRDYRKNRSPHHQNKETRTQVKIREIVATLPEKTCKFVLLLAASPTYRANTKCKNVVEFATDELYYNTIRLKLSLYEKTSYPLDLFTGIVCENDNINELCVMLSTMLSTQDDIARFIITHITHEDEQHKSK
ncbi:hypothetical protein LSAT2_030253 [Lamellibrachia satsuma]|nr:hypothetical protein LSAT2_030253 [Lamellibrachia satsuma]